MRLFTIALSLIVAFAFGVATAPALAFNYAQWAMPVMLIGLALLALIHLDSRRKAEVLRKRHRTNKKETLRETTIASVMKST